jgi:hypothetical protein
LAQLAIGGTLRRHVVTPDGSSARREELMRALRVSANGVKPITAGFPGPHVVSTIISSVIREPGRKAPTGEALPERELQLSVGGLDTAAREHVSWLIAELEVGDKIVVEVVEVDSVDPPTSRRGGKAQPGAPKKPAKPAKTAKRAPARPVSVKGAPKKKPGGKRRS